MSPARSRRAPSRAKSALPPSDAVREAQQLLLPLVLAFVLAALLAWPARLPAQAAVAAASSGTHTVRPGETLWSLAGRYFGDGHKWRELATMNGLPEGGERGLTVGQVLRVPTGETSLAESRAAMAEAPPAQTPRVATTPAADVPGPDAPVAAKRVEPRPGDALVAVPPASPEPVAAPRVIEAPRAEASTDAAGPAGPAGTGGASRTEGAAGGERRIGLVRPTDFARARGRDNTTVFLGPAPFDADTMRGTIWLDGDESFVAPATRRVGEFQAAPVALSATAWRSVGRVGARATTTGSSAGRGAQRMQQSDLVEVRLPTGADSSPGTQFVAYSAGADLGRGARLGLPTGVLTLEAPRNGVAVARVTRIYGVIEHGQALLPYVEAPEAPAPSDVSPVAATVRWVTDAPLLPSLQAYLVLSSDALSEIVTGDRFQLVADDPPGAPVATVRIVRVTPEGATAIVTHHEQPGIRVGLSARRIGRAP